MKNFFKYTGVVKYILVIVSFAACGFIYIISIQKEAYKDESSTLYASQTAEISDNTAGIIENSTVAEVLTVQNKADDICVYICGNIINPGVYMVKKNTRVYEIIELAGGFGDEADDTALNLAGVVYDGQKLYIPAKGEKIAEVDGKIQTEKALVNLNTADKAELMTLPGIGESKAEDILQYRKNKGAFKTIEEIKNISGIKEAAFNKIKDLICV